jgi:hypothetical protein
MPITVALAAFNGLWVLTLFVRSEVIDFREGIDAQWA